MKRKFYFDTAIWRDYYEDRSDSSKPIGKLALQLIEKIIREDNLILYSDLVVQELMIKYSKEEISAIFSIIYNLNLLVKVAISKEQAREAADLCSKRKIPFADALHSILARDNKSVMVTRDNHFQKIADIVETKKPEEIL